MMIFITNHLRGYEKRHRFTYYTNTEKSSLRKACLLWIARYKFKQFFNEFD